MAQPIKYLMLFLSFFCLITSCFTFSKKEKQNQDQIQKMDFQKHVYLNIENASEWDFQQIKVQINEQELIFSALKSGAISNYQQLELLYPYAFIQITFSDGLYILQPIDFLGEKPIRQGLYSYKFHTNPKAKSVKNRLQLEFIKKD